jgi:ribulose-5-phosphate 4-epimerase/fuculose-1-phosphate aldolase
VRQEALKHPGPGGAPGGASREPIGGLERLKARARKRRRHRASALDSLGGRFLSRRREPADVLPPITAYYVMKIGTLPLIPYYRPGDKQLAEAVRAVAHKHHGVVLANHGPVVAGSSLSAAGAAVEELEETARLHLLLHGHPTRILTPEQITELREALPS